jgi:hypothetical protein
LLLLLLLLRSLMHLMLQAAAAPKGWVLQVC